MFIFFEIMEKSEFRVLIKHCFLMGKNTVQAKQWLDKCYGESSPSRQMVEKWMGEFKRGRTSTSDAERSGRPKEVTTEEMVNKVHDIVIDDPKIKLREIVEMTNISYERVQNILHQHLDMKKLTARWVPRVLTVDQKRFRVRDSQYCLAMFTRNPKDFMHRLITMDETWIHHYTPESQQQAKQWVAAGGSAPTRPKTQQSAGKVMASVFWDMHGVIFIDYLEKGKTITGEYYCGLLDKLKEEIKKNRPYLNKKKVLFLHDNAPSHRSLKSQAKLNELRFEMLPHPPYSPDLAPSDYYLFPNLKRWLQGKRFTSNEQVELETDGYFAELSKSYYTKGIEMLKDRWTKCIELKGDYVEGK